MITIFNHSFKSISQDFYDNTIHQLDFHMLTCSCGHSSCLSKHAYYLRRIKTSSGFTVLRICRVKCTICNKTHALLPAEIIPYSQIPFLTQVQITSQSLAFDPDYLPIMEEIPEIDESNIQSIVSSFRRFWKERLLSQSISISNPTTLFLSCFSHFKRQFMQIKKTVNILFLQPT